MYLHRKICSHLSLFVFLGAVTANSGQALQELVPQAEPLKERVLLYYRTVQKSDKVAALGLVAPESKNDFFRIRYDGLVDFRILDVHLSDTGDSATVKMLRTDSFPGFPQLLDHTTIDPWKRIDGQWYIVLPTLKNEVDTPFGKMRLGGPSKDSQAALPPGLLEHQKNVDPSQLRKAIEQVNQDENKKDAAAKKIEEKKEPDPSPKPEQQATPKPPPQR